MPPLGSVRLAKALGAPEISASAKTAMLLYALCYLNHVVIHADFERVIGEIVNLVDGDFLHSGLTGNIPLLLGGEQAID